MRELDLICFFWEGLQLSIQAEIALLDKEYMNRNKLAHKITVREARSQPRLTLQIQKVDLHFLRGNWPRLQAKKN